MFTRCFQILTINRGFSIAINQYFVDFPPADCAAVSWSWSPVEFGSADSNLSWLRRDLLWFEIWMVIWKLYSDYSGIEENKWRLEVVLFLWKPSPKIMAKSLRDCVSLKTMCKTTNHLPEFVCRTPLEILLCSEI
jgi:hypothetical protein